MYMCTKIAKQIQFDFLVGGRSYEDSDIEPYRKPKIADEDRMPTNTSDWHRRLAQKRHKPDIDLDSFAPKIKATNEEDQEEAYMRSAREQKDRVSRIRKAQNAAKVIQRTWKTYKNKK